MFVETGMRATALRQEGHVCRFKSCVLSPFVTLAQRVHPHDSKSTNMILLTEGGHTVAGTYKNEPPDGGHPTTCVDRISKLWCCCGKDQTLKPQCTRSTKNTHCSKAQALRH